MKTALHPRPAARYACLLLTGFAFLAIEGCHVSTSDQGDRKNVDIGTPFGSMRVNTGYSADLMAIGLSAYPGAVPEKDDHGKDENNADVNLSFGKFHLGVRAASFETQDPTEKVISFYRSDLGKRYGDVIECQNGKTVGSPSRTSQGLTCDDSKGTHMHTRDHGKNGISLGSDSDFNIELRAGSKQHQHIVGVETEDGATKIGLVAVDLPSDHDSKEVE